MTNLMIIVNVAVIAFAACAVLALVFYRIDKNADRRDSEK